jgi:hypothetical protein
VLPTIDLATIGAPLFSMAEIGSPIEARRAAISLAADGPKLTPANGAHLVD